jgi:hypothetical protein
VVVDITRLGGYVAGSDVTIQAAIVAYLNSLGWGATVYPAALEYITQTIIPDMTNPAFELTTLTIALHGGSQGTASVVLTAIELTQEIAANVTVNIT